MAKIPRAVQQEGGWPRDELDGKTCTDLTVPRKNVSLAEVFQCKKENGNDEDGEGSLHAGVQAGGGVAGRGRPEHCRCGRTLGVVDQTLFDWVRAQRQNRLKGADSKVVSAEQMEISQDVLKRVLITRLHVA